MAPSKRMALLAAMAIGALWACSGDDGDSADAVCAKAASITERCGGEVTATGGSCTGAGQASATCAVDNEEAYCAFIRDPLAATPDNAFVKCSAQVASSDAGAAPVSAEAESFIGSFCATFVPCCAGKVSGADRFCPANRRQDASGRTFDPAAASACLAVLRAADFAEGASCKGLEMPEACRNVFRTTPAGSVAPGGECAGPLDCATPAGGGVARCIDNRYGPSFNNQKICEVRIENRKDGEACGEMVGATGKKFYASCDPALDCRKKADGASACARFAAAGEPCNANKSTETLPRCAADFSCELTKGCVARPKLNESCSSSTTCAGGLVCLRGDGGSTCLPKLANGETCRSDGECASGACPQRVCIARPSIGGSADDDRICSVHFDL